MKKIIKFLIILLVLMFATNDVTNPYEKKDFLWKIHSVTPFNIKDDNKEFKIGDFNRDGIEDIYVIIRNKCGLIEIYILDGSKNYTTSIYNVTTSLTYKNCDCDFNVEDFNHDGYEDLICIKKIDEQNSEIHILDGKNNFQSYILQKRIPVECSGKDFVYNIGDYNNDHFYDLYCINRKENCNPNIKILDGKKDYNKCILDKTLNLKGVNKDWEFEVEDYNTDGVPDLYCLNKKGKEKLEVHILDGKSKYKDFSIESSTIMDKINNKADILVGKGRLNIFCVLLDGTSTNKVEVHKFGFKDDIDGKAQKIIDEAMKYLNTPYLWGGTTPKGFDCSGFTSYLYKKVANINIGRSTYDQIYSGKEVKQSDLKKGDLIFPNKGHVCIYIGNGKMIHSPKKGDSVKISNVYGFWRGRRIL